MSAPLTRQGVRDLNQMGPRVRRPRRPPEEVCAEEGHLWVPTFDYIQVGDEWKEVTHRCVRCKTQDSELDW